MKLHNQSKDYYLRNSCTIVTLLHIMMLNIWISVTPDFLMKIAIFFDKAGKWFPNFWGYFDVVYWFFVQNLNKKLKLNFRIKKTRINKLTIRDSDSWWIWAPKYNKRWLDVQKKGEFLASDIKYIKAHEGKTYWHNFLWDWSKGWYMVNSFWNKPAKCKLDVLNKLAEEGLLWQNIRTIEPADKFTSDVCEITRQMARYEQEWRLDYYIENIINLETAEIIKAKELYFYGR